jgi:hypothetical protein
LPHKNLLYSPKGKVATSKSNQEHAKDIAWLFRTTGLSHRCAWLTDTISFLLDSDPSPKLKKKAGCFESCLFPSSGKEVPNLAHSFFFFFFSFVVLQLMLPEAPQPYGLLYYPRIGP